MAVTPTPLFLAGLGRSGTTALWDVYSHHPQIVLGVERYKQLWSQSELKMPRELFDRERFFDFEDGLTNLRPDDPRWGPHYKRMAAKWDDARYVGDKMTTVRIKDVMENLPDAKFVCIVRDIAEVAASWDRRARNEADTGWSAQADARRSVLKWNQTLWRIGRSVRRYPEQVCVVEYSRFFGDPDATSLRATLDWLGLEAGPEVLARFDAVHRDYLEAVAPKDRALADDDRDYIEQEADRQAWRDVLALSV